MASEYMDYMQFLDFAAKLASELGLELDQGRLWAWCVFLVSYSGDGTGYCLTRPRGDMRTEVTPIYPPTSYSFPDLPGCLEGGGRIGLTISRGPHAVAVDIDRHLAPAYRARLTAIAEHDTAEARLTGQREELAAQIAGLFPDAARPSHCQGNHSTTVSIYGPGYCGGQVRFSGGAAEVEFIRFRIPAKVALEMLAFYARTIRAAHSDELRSGFDADPAS